MILENVANAFILAAIMLLIPAAYGVWKINKSEVFDREFHDTVGLLITFSRVSNIIGVVLLLLSIVFR